MIAPRRRLPPDWLLLALLGSSVAGTLRAETTPKFEVRADDTRPDSQGWLLVSNSLGSESWKQPTGDWAIFGDARLHPENPRLLAGEPGTGTLINGPTGRTSNLLTSKEFGDVEFHCEFMVPERSNAGVKFNAVYEVQIFDSYGKEKPTASDCGGIYPRADLFPRYHHIDEGFAPLVNACRPPGTWQTLDIIFLAPKFDESGRKVSNARFVEVRLNGQVVQDDVELAAPTGNNWWLPERPQGPILLQADHGPVALRDVRVRELSNRAGTAAGSGARSSVSARPSGVPSP